MESIDNFNAEILQNIEREAIYHPYGRLGVVDCKGISYDILNSEQDLRLVIQTSAEAAGITIMSLMAHNFDQQGITICAVLAESHMSIHTYPEHGVAMLDVFTCGNVDPSYLLRLLIEALSPEEHSFRMIERGFRP